MQLTLTRVIIKKEDKNGIPLRTKTGRPYTRASIQTNEFGNTWLGGFGDPRLVVGAVIDAEVTDRTWNGKTYKDFSLNKKGTTVTVEDTSVMAEIIKIQLAIGALGNRLKSIEDKLDNKPAYPVMDKSNDGLWDNSDGSVPEEYIQ